MAVNKIMRYRVERQPAPNGIKHEGQLLNYWKRLLSCAGKGGGQNATRRLDVLYGNAL
jgi:hypothetical protein